MNSYRSAGTLLLAALAANPITLAGAIEHHDVIRVVETAPADRDAMAGRKLRALLEEIVAAGGYTSLPKFDEVLTRMKALGPEMFGTRAAPIYERTLKDLEGERTRLAVQLGRDPTEAPAVADGPYTDFEWMGQSALSALTNPLQREDFRASLAHGIDFNVGVASLAPTPTGWLVQMSGRLGIPGRPGQGFFCRVDGADAASLAVLRGITPPYGIVHVSAPGIDEFMLQDRPLRVRIVFEGCRIKPQSDGTNRSSHAGPSGQNQSASTGSAPRGAAGGTGEPIAPSPAGLRCTSNPLRNDPQRAMARRLRRAWAIPEALRDDPSLQLTFAVTLNFDAELQAAPRLLRSQSQRATPGQLTDAADAADRAIRTTAPFPELGQYAGGTMQVDLTPCD